MSAHVEETLERVLASRVVWVKVIFLRLLDRLLDIPEHVGGQLVEDLRCCGLRHARVERAAQIGNIVVLLSLLESVELTCEDLVPLFLIEASFRHLIEHSDTELIVLRLNNLNVLALLEVFSETFLREMASDFLLLDLVEDGTILKGLRAREGLKDSLLE